MAVAHSFLPKQQTERARAEARADIEIEFDFEFKTICFLLFSFTFRFSRSVRQASGVLSFSLVITELCNSEIIQIQN